MFDTGFIRIAKEANIYDFRLLNSKLYYYIFK
jgi:hypothetical protein